MTLMICHHRFVKTSRWLLNEESPRESQRKWTTWKMNSTISLTDLVSSQFPEITSTQLIHILKVITHIQILGTVEPMVITVIHMVATILIVITFPMATSDLNLHNQRVLSQWFKLKQMWSIESTRSLQATPLIINTEAKYPNMFLIIPNPNSHGIMKPLSQSPASKQLLATSKSPNI